MGIRSDLVVEQRELNAENIPGVEDEHKKIGSIEINDIKITNETAAAKLMKPVGEYITIEFDSLERLVDYVEIKKAIFESLEKIMPKERSSILIAGLGNMDITPDAVGPLAINKIFATRHINSQFAESIGLKGLKSVAAIAPGVLGKTGIEVMEIIAGVVERIKPDAVIVIDALAARNTYRLCNTFQLSNTGISPGSGVKNSRKEISQNTLHIPVIAIGIPTVVDASTLAYDLTGNTPKNPPQNMIVTPKEIDLLIEKAADIISQSLNLFLQPEIDEDIIQGLV